MRRMNRYPCERLPSNNGPERSGLLGVPSARRLVFGVADMVSPVRWSFGDRQVGHEMVAGRTMPVLFAVGGVDDVAGPDLDSLIATGLDEATAFGDVKGLSAFMGVPRGACSRVEVDCIPRCARLPNRDPALPSPARR